MELEFLKIKQENSDKKVEIWTEDEARLGLQPTIRRTWSPKGKRFIAGQVRKYQWIYTYAFVHPLTGKSFWLILPTVNTKIMNIALKEFSDYVNPEKEKKILLLMDNAGFHTSGEMEIPENIKIFPLPAYSPELQPAECGWPLLKESVANICFDSLNTLEAAVCKRCEWLEKNPEILKGAVGFSWIQEIESNTV